MTTATKKYTSKITELPKKYSSVASCDEVEGFPLGKRCTDGTVLDGVETLGNFGARVEFNFEMVDDGVFGMSP